MEINRESILSQVDTRAIYAYNLFLFSIRYVESYLCNIRYRL